MEILNHQVRIPTYKVLFSVFFLLFIAFVVSYIIFDPNSESSVDIKVATLLGGGCVGFGVATLQLFITIVEQKKISFYESLKIHDVFSDRDDKNIYRDLIEGSFQVIDVMGNTCSRLVEDFAQFEVGSSNALIRALERSVRVRLLISNPDSLINDGDKAAIETKTLIAAKKLKTTFPHLFELRLLAGKASHNIMLCDNICLIGPIFDQIKSKDTPALKTDKDSIISKVYLENFEAEWKQSELI
ncbi:hypothetical protein [Marinobacter sp. LV10MA510-1]|uniref:hypothetical protein n=1 Tax=Marinobacter sp. LV10MA510-1 TaxID=1415567 RepID=UPI000BF90DCB|nr:hypothetical protein [Marinobacter sp. LV10MA510-1]PFG11399.1 hypothetical protein ATI45_3912 [Marinobacter sp. LV10MA510-1]